MKCPFSTENNFVQELAEHLPPSPLDLFGAWKDHLACRWLAAGLSGQDTAGVLRAGLKRLRHADHFLVQDDKFREELLLKKKNLDDPNKKKIKLVMEPDSLEAQNEMLELFMAVLPEQYPELYTYDATNHSITVHPIDTTFYINDWAHCPLELCERIVQEDLILMRPGPPQPGSKQDDGYYMAAAAVIFSFSELQEKLGQPVEFIHAPVPGYEQHLRKTMNLMFQKLKVEQPLWRNNWGLALNGVLDQPLYGSEWNQQARTMQGEEDVTDLFLKVEYQTIRRLPRTNYLLFTVKTMVDTVSGLEHVPPEAARCLARSIRGMSPAMHTYKGIANQATCQTLLQYLDKVGGASQ